MDRFWSVRSAVPVSIAAFSLSETSCTMESFIGHRSRFRRFTFPIALAILFKYRESLILRWDAVNESMEKKHSSIQTECRNLYHAVDGYEPLKTFVPKWSRYSSFHCPQRSSGYQVSSIWARARLWFLLCVIPQFLQRLLDGWIIAAYIHSVSKSVVSNFLQ